ncbi:hypothetical protein FisN_20Hh116 [Fistulifera solaris]|uniref:Uncharacterized protein n=1 Tax=Fistulifera solaris TaxID=1519565 RepID=A0A1Z5KCB6_FISSO|nr:hypothetical protein FisN_20Hh116 [Fistulifera solaris]|eukprot:GAX23909.1 hypothetical protein FisN_20Hh116 [Fistulifera solaris]
MTTLSQFVALHFVYRRLFLGCGFLPLLTLIAPVLLWVYLGVWNILSGGYAGVTHVLSLGIAVTAYHGIHTLSKTEESRQRALQINRQYVPVLMICCALLIHVTASSMGLRSFSGPYGWVFSFRDSLRMSFVLTLLGIAILARFMGPQSLVRCSTVPLAPNPVYVALRDIWTDPLSIVQPGDTPGKLLTHTFDRAPRNSRRFQTPLLASELVHTALAMVLGVMLALVMELPTPQGHHELLGPAMQWWTSVFIYSLSLLLPVLNLEHELDPRNVSMNLKSSLTRASKNTFFAILFAAILSITFFHSTGSGIRWTARVGIHSLLVSLYIEFLQQIISMALFYPRSDCQLLVHELYDDGTELPYVKVLLCGILRGDEAVNLMHKVTAEQDEYDRIRKYAGSLASAQLKMGATAGVEKAEAMLEEDVLQLVLLESVYSTRKAVVQLLDTPHSLYLFRALCVTISTFAEILLRCTSLQSSTELVLPPGFLCAIEYSIVGISRCIQQSFPGGSDWTLSPLATVLPSVLESIFSLRLALLDFAQRRGDGRPVGLHFPELIHLVRLCDTATRQWIEGKSVKLWNMATEEWVREIKTRPAT